MEWNLLGFPFDEIIISVSTIVSDSLVNWTAVPSSMSLRVAPRLDDLCYCQQGQKNVALLSYPKLSNR